ncbi:acetate--CoA ligase [Candidatus Woesearchaeota archaeon]|nr:acetate--CoA ligase [Candidatus Woesearchaeota archaeon]
MEARHITSILSEERLFKPPKDFSKKAHIRSLQEYRKLYDASIRHPEKFWAEKAGQLHWFRKWEKVFSNNKGFFKWFEGGRINVCYNCLDRHIGSKGGKTALIWEAEDGSVRKFTYSELLALVSRFSNVLVKNGLRKGDRVCIYLPMIPELVISMLACARLGIIHSIVFGGFSSDSLSDRIRDSGARMLITADGGFRNGKVVPLKENSDAALRGCRTVSTVIVVKRAGNSISMQKGRDLWWHDEFNDGSMSGNCRAEELDSEDPLFILYTSGTTGKPKGILHTQAGYLLYVYQTFKWVFDIRDEDVYFCTADIGWITGHSYIVYGPLSNAATVLMYEGSPTYPAPDRFWNLIEKHKATIFYTAPTAIRALAKYGDGLPSKCNLGSLRLLGTVGEPINPEAWMWYYNVIGRKKCPIVDTWWQTETGGILITPLPGATPLKPGSATFPFPGIVADVLREDGTRAGPNEGGNLVILRPWPGMLRTIWKNPGKYTKFYFSRFKGVYYAGDIEKHENKSGLIKGHSIVYLPGDSSKVDKDGYFWIMGRLDDVIKVAGHRIGTAEVESALVSHKAVAEAAIVPYPHDIKGWAIYAFVTLKHGFGRGEKLSEELKEHVSKTVGAIAKPDKIQFAYDLPKTRSGKIMRRILKSIAEGSNDYGNISTLADPSVVEKLARERV